MQTVFRDNTVQRVSSLKTVPGSAEHVKTLKAAFGDYRECLDIREFVWRL